jgi:hypothetical protein
VQLFKGNKATIFNNFAKKERNARGASDLNPIETTTPQGAVDASFGKHWWNTGPNPTYKFGDQWVVSDRLLVDLQYAHIGNNFTLGFHSPELRDVQPTLIISTGLNGRSFQEQVFIRPVNSVTFNSCRRWPAAITRSSSAPTGATRTRCRCCIAAASPRSASRPTSATTARRWHRAARWI